MSFNIPTSLASDCSFLLNQKQTCFFAEKNVPVQPNEICMYVQDDVLRAVFV